jgi:hypothetical protein
VANTGMLNALSANMMPLLDHEETRQYLERFL